MAKLTKAQEHVVSRMKEGWELGESQRIINCRVWLQKDGLGRGGVTETVAASTFRVLKKAGVVVCVESKYPINKYHLSDTEVK